MRWLSNSLKMRLLIHRKFALFSCSCVLSRILYLSIKGSLLCSNLFVFYCKLIFITTCHIIKIYFTLISGCVLGTGILLVSLGILTVVLFDPAVNKFIHKVSFFFLWYCCSITQCSRMKRDLIKFNFFNATN